MALGGHPVWDGLGAPITSTNAPGSTTNALDVNVKTGGSTPTRPGTAAQSSVANATSNTTILAANANRLGATVFNDDTVTTGATLKLKLGSASSATSFTVAVVAQGYYEVPFGYTGIITGIASAATGNARVTELTA